MTLGKQQQKSKCLQGIERLQRIQCLWSQIDLVKIRGLQNSGMNVEWGCVGRRVADVTGGS